MGYILSETVYMGYLHFYFRRGELRISWQSREKLRNTSYTLTWVQSHARSLSFASIESARFGRLLSRNNAIFQSAI